MEEGRTQKDDIHDTIVELLDKEDITILKTALADLHPADIADAVSRIDRNRCLDVLNLLDTEHIA